ncbi:hypothetical protein [Nocardioides litoris]|uniref:hypothetical protein n=1 Tax=Nocardioides litoris TaxID=1926648 RepID=UPI0011215952|nr:hypothetical protein [Nocardioides litoris]
MSYDETDPDATAIAARADAFSDRVTQQLRADEPMDVVAVLTEAVEHLEALTDAVRRVRAGAPGTR